MEISRLKNKDSMANKSSNHINLLVFFNIN